MVWHHVNSIALSFVSSKEALISSSICPGVQAKATNLTVHPFTSELSPVVPLVGASPADAIVVPLSVVRGSIGPLVLAFTALLTVLVIAVVL